MFKPVVGSARYNGAEGLALNQKRLKGTCAYGMRYDEHTSGGTSPLLKSLYCVQSGKTLEGVPSDEWQLRQ